MRPGQNVQPVMAWGTWLSLSREGPWDRESPRAVQTIFIPTALLTHTHPPPLRPTSSVHFLELGFCSVEHQLCGNLTPPHPLGTVTEGK